MTGARGVVDWQQVFCESVWPGSFFFFFIQNKSFNLQVTKDTWQAAATPVRGALERLPSSRILQPERHGHPITTPHPPSRHTPGPTHPGRPPHTCAPAPRALWGTHLRRNARGPQQPARGSAQETPRLHAWFGKRSVCEDRGRGSVLEEM